jgi:hypothetical protein
MLGQNPRTGTLATGSSRRMYEHYGARFILPVPGEERKDSRLLTSKPL